MSWILQGSAGVREQPQGWGCMCTRWVKGSPEAGRQGNGSLFSSPCSLPAAPRVCKHVSHESYPLLLLNIYSFKQKLKRWNLAPQTLPKKQSSPGSYSCKNKRTSVLRELKMARGEEIHRIASVAGSVTRCRLMFWVLPKPVSAKLLMGSGVQWLSQGFMFLLLAEPADIKQTPGNLEMSKHFLFLFPIHGGLFTVLLARRLHTENIFKFFIFYGAASFYTTSTPLRDFDETLQKGESCLAVKFQEC